MSRQEFPSFKLFIFALSMLSCESVSHLVCSGNEYDVFQAHRILVHGVVHHVGRTDWNLIYITSQAGRIDNPSYQFKLTEGQKIIAPEFCGLKPETGFCRAAFFKYFYNPQSRDCEEFTYGGCGGNDNRFDTYSDCMSTCSDANTSYEYYK